MIATVNGFGDMVGFIWSVADLLRGDYKQSEYGRVVLPFTVLRRLDCVLEPTKPAVLAKVAELRGQGVDNVAPVLRRVARQKFYNASEFANLRAVLADPDHLRRNLVQYVDGLSPEAQEVLEKYSFTSQVERLAEAKLLYQVTAKFADIDLHPDRLSNHDMGYVFEELIRKFSEISNETAGEHFTPREVIRLMVNLLLAPDDDTLATPGIVKTVYDPACGTGGMLSEMQEHVRHRNSDATIEVFGQELNGETYAICRSDMMMKGGNPEHIAFGNSFSNDGHPGRRFDYMLANPPFGVEWKKVEKTIRDEAELGGLGRFAAGLPRIDNGSLLFLQHMISKMRPVKDGGTRLAIVFNGSPLFTGAAGSGESEIRRWILENDWLEAIVALPDQLFYNTGISTYFWILSNRKSPDHAGKVILLDARDYWTKMRKSLGEKRKQVAEPQIAEVTRIYADALAIAADPDHEHHAKVKVFATTDFGYQRITVERPLRLRFEVTDETVAEIAETKQFRALIEPPKRGRQEALALALANGEKQQRALIDAVRSLAGTSTTSKAEFATHLAKAYAEHAVGKLPVPLDKVVWSAVSIGDPEGELQTDRKGNPLPDSDLRDNENVPLGEDIDTYVKREVLPYARDAWIDHDKTKLGYEIPFTRHFYVYTPPRPLAEIDVEIKKTESEIQFLLREVVR